MGYQIIIAEDHDATRSTLATILAKRGHSVRTAKTGEEAFRLSSDCKADLLICDIGLPDVNGWVMLNRLRNHCPNLPAIAVTGYGQPDDVDESLKSGFVEHLTKPFSIEQLEAAINRAVPKKPAGAS
jgi:CheY-like chemotaxis protein